MAPLPPQNTARYFLDYTTTGRNHTMEVRAIGAHSPAAFGSVMNGILLATTSLYNLITVSTVRFAVNGSVVSNPVTSGIEGNTYGSGAGTADDAPRAINFVGRSPAGRRVRLMIFGYKGGISTWRVTTAESVPIQNALATINGDANFFAAIDGIKAIWKPYVNVMYNAYWTRKVRA